MGTQIKQKTGGLVKKAITEFIKEYKFFLLIFFIYFLSSGCSESRKPVERRDIAFLFIVSAYLIGWLFHKLFKTIHYIYIETLRADYQRKQAVLEKREEDFNKRFPNATLAEFNKFIDDNAEDLGLKDEKFNQLNYE